MNLNFSGKYFLRFFIAFVVVTPIGTILHELGHIYVAHQLGFETTLNYASMNWGGKESSSIESFWVSFGGPLQTMITGTIGFWYCFENKEIKKFGIKFRHWLGIFLGLFWLRPIFNLMQGFYFKLIGQNDYYFSGDEAFLSDSLGFPTGSLSIFFGVLGIIVCSYLVFRVVPESLRFTFILAGLTGSLGGFWIWMEVLGPMIF